ncbi:unnamed protein product [Phytophthora fragariaefolia]|uniref:Unnamed protein product n=1 Tax=Phytophthora fragariaefolia TaxID=1490495 RepID=A0A9W6WPJ9_9STRA|nr:unnamed protein product [Phytophthora fragariaefolia]
MDSSDEENTPPNVPALPHCNWTSNEDDVIGTGTATRLLLTPEGRSIKKRSESGTSPPLVSVKPVVSSPPLRLRAASPTTSLPVVLETPPRAPRRPRTEKTRRPSQTSRQNDRRVYREASAAYARCRAAAKVNHSSIKAHVAVPTHHIGRSSEASCGVGANG